jgi:hypothetical protein
MVFTSLISKASDLVVLGLVNEVMIETRYPFNTSTNFLVLASEYYGKAYSAPDPEGSFYNLVTQAQINSVRNGGLNAIYESATRSTRISIFAQAQRTSWLAGRAASSAIHLHLLYMTTP